MAKPKLIDRVNEAYQNQNVNAFLNLLSWAEGTENLGENGYNVGFGGTTFDSYDAHPNVRREFKERSGKKNYTTAAGRYQTIARTYNRKAKQLGINDFSPESQDKVAISLLIERNALEDIKKGDLRSAVNKLGNEWASLPSSKADQPSRSWDRLVQRWNQENISIPNEAPATVADAQAEYRDNLANAGAMQGTMPVDSMAGVPQVPLDVASMGGATGTIGGVDSIVLPSTAEEEQTINSIALGGYDDRTRGTLLNLINQLADANEQEIRSGAIFDPYPTMYDDQLLNLIETA